MHEPRNKQQVRKLQTNRLATSDNYANLHKARSACHIAQSLGPATPLSGQIPHIMANSPNLN